jgi:hypothetical protein
MKSMEGLVGKLFPEGQRKLLVSLIALAIGIVLEKFAGGLTDNMRDSLIAIVAIFTGGNVMEHLANALKIVKGTRVGQIIEDMIPGDQGLGKEPDPVQEQSEEEDELQHRLYVMEQAQKVQANNISSIVNMLNRMSGQGQTGSVQPPMRKE